MENATDALMIAFAILLTILILSLFVWMIGKVFNFNKGQEQQEEIQRLEKWNEEWEAYNKKMLYGSEVLTVINKAEQNNIDNMGNDQINVIVLKDGEELQKLEINTKNIFECKEMKRNKKNRIYEIVFEFIE